MRDLILAAGFLLMGLLGYLLMSKVDQFLENNRKNMIKKTGDKQILIAAESPFLAGSIMPAVELCEKEGPSTAFFLYSGQPESLLKSLTEGQVDLLILSEGTIFKKEEGYEYMLLPFRNTVVTVDGFDQVVNGMEEANLVYVVWNSRIVSPNRDWLISVMRNGFQN